MQIRSSKMKWAALGIGILLMACHAAPTQADWWKFKSKSKAVDECPPDEVEVVENCPPKKNRCKRCGRCAGQCNCSCFLAVNPYYCDPRDRQVYSAQGYGVPITIPMVPGAITYNYGWGIPSTRLSATGGYAAMWPDKPYSQNGGNLPGGYPTAYHPTDTAQFGVYYNQVPTWQRRW